ncbi:carotenoid oxygenase family protein [Nannocystis sp. RBIL2]|uniref:carotenoid oxygenase family protein n=1 Tax=Nannocystis sp. RBIL2 TaxID=2996788 RepID=UPI00226EB745|nr:carotenoid oxygenase family protein [Nannocystis sp. RBIL2]MCY1065119.1 carotenoid oxygenase family protein [Nannocystis sp. RBIL2]
MKATIHRTWTSLLPEADAHPYRTGAWRPQLNEWDADDLDVVAGAIPDDLAGLYVRNTENPLVPAFERYHPFDGDGMLHAIRFAGGRARYRNRVVPTRALAQELAAGGPQYAGIAEDPRLSRHPGWGARGGMKDASSTDVIVHRGRVLSTHYQCGDAYAFDAETMEPLGPESWVPQDTGISAHPKVCARTGELHYFRYGKAAPYLHYGVVDARGERVHDVAIPLPGPRLPHDMALSERFVVFNDFPIFWDPALLPRGIHRPRYDPSLPSRFAVLPRRGRTDEVRWFEAAATYVLHFTNAFEDGDELVLDGYAQRDPMPRPQPELHGEYAWLMRQVDLASLRPSLRRWRMNLATGACREEDLSPTLTEFPTIDPRAAGVRHRHVWSMTGKPGWFLFDGILHTDLGTGRERHFGFDPGVYASEVAVVPRPGGAGEGDAWIVTFVSDTVHDLSECQIFAAHDVAAGPIARVRLPERIASGTHATWSHA